MSLYCSFRMVEYVTVRSIKDECSPKGAVPGILLGVLVNHQRQSRLLVFLQLKQTYEALIEKVKRQAESQHSSQIPQKTN